MTRKERIAWAAGFFDGEGSVGSYAAGSSFYQANELRRYKYPKVSISNTDRALLVRFKTIFKLGEVYGPYVVPGKAHWKPKFSYRLDGHDRVTELFAQLKPFLGKAKTKDFVAALRNKTR